MATEKDLERIVDLVRKLTPRQRRELVQRLRVSGLLPADTTGTDRNRLTKATALGKRPAAPANPGPTSINSDNENKSDKADKRPGTAAPLPLRFVGPGNAGQAGTNRRIGGKVVIGVPTGEEQAADPHAMPPLPGQAPEQPISIIFDGGSKGNPGIGYGSYALRWPGQSQQIVQLQFGDNITNNEAEYDTLAAALDAVVQRLRDQGADPTTARVEIRGDSQLVINQVLGEWKCNDDRMRTRRDRVRSLLREFGSWDLAYHPRANSVRVLGH